MTATQRIEFAHMQDVESVQLFAAAQLTYALKGCARGNQADCRWLERCGIDYMDVVAPGAVPEEAARQMIDTALSNQPAQLGQAMRSRNLR